VDSKIYHGEDSGLLQDVHGKINVGDKAPDFFLQSQTGEKEAIKLYGLPSTRGLMLGRVTYVIDKEGVIRHIFSSQFQSEKHIEEAIKRSKNYKTSQEKSTQPQTPKVRANRPTISNKCSENQMRSFISLM
jgi:hypothetical protein